MLQNMPKIVTIRLQRFASSGDGNSRKIVSLFPMPDKIDFAQYVTPVSDSPILYRLKMFIFHRGSFGFGHYIFYVKNDICNDDDDRNWFEINDDSVNGRLSRNGINEIKKFGYIYFYERVDV